jgi:transposase-like protein
MRTVTEITEALCGQSFSHATISRITAKLHEDLKRFAQRPLEEEYWCVILDARYERVREGGVIRSPRWGRRGGRR